MPLALYPHHTPLCIDRPFASASLCRLHILPAPWRVQVDVRNARGAHSAGKKITGILPVPGQPSQLLVSSNDSRLRLYDSYHQLVKYKGHRNLATQSRAAVSPCGSTLACGSDDGWVHLWERLPAAGVAAWQPGKNPASEAFQVTGGPAGGERRAVTAAAAGAPGDGVAAQPAGGGSTPVVAVAFAPPGCRRVGKGGGAAAAVVGVGGGDVSAIDPLTPGQSALRHVVVAAGWHGMVRVFELWGY